MTTEREPLTADQLAHDLADARTANAFLTYERDRIQAELDHYIAAVMTAEDTDTPLLFTVLRRLKVAERDAAQWEHEATKRQAECIRLGTRIQELETALRTVESHHVTQNQIKGRDESRSYTLQLVRAALGAD